MISTSSKRAGAAATLAALLLTACATPQYPVYREPASAPPPPPPAPVPQPRDPDAPTAAPSTPVQSAPLPPVGQAVPAAPAAPAPAAAQAQAQAPAAATTPGVSPWARPAAVTDIPSQVTLGRGETLFDVAERVRTPVRALIELNRLQPPYDLPPGTVLRVPPPLFYTVAPGDTLSGIGRRFNIEPRSLANLNGLPFDSPIRAGQRIALPSLARDQGASTLAAGPTPSGMATASTRARTPARQTARSAPPRAAAPAATASAAPSAAATSAPPAAADPADLDIAAVGRGRFTWPIRGEVLSGFGPKGPGQRNDGLNIAAGAGDVVRAAAAGDVVFAGELPSFGNLVLIKHSDGWVTAYAHLSRIDVKMRQSVIQGAPVGLAGQTGMVDRPQVHFEIRYAETPREKARPVDPALLLPKAG